MNFKEDLLNTFYFNLSFFQAPLKRQLSNKLKVIRVIFTSNFLLYYIVLYYTQFNERLWDHGNSNTYEKPWTCDAKTKWWRMSSGRRGAVGNMHIFVPCQTDVVNKQLVFRLTWNNSLSNTALGELYIRKTLLENWGNL